jgi:hypothetical protein
VSVPLLLRLGVLALLTAALWLPRAAGSADRAPLWLGASSRAAAVERALVADASLPTAVLRAAEAPPDRGELEALAALGERAPLHAALPRGVASVEARAPIRPLVGRASALGFAVRGRAGDTLTVRLGDGTGILDSARVVLDPAGRSAGAFRLRPPRPGWREWFVEAGGARASTGAWVDSVPAPRVLVRAGMPHWEAKFVVRALEESGAAVETAYDLGRGLSVAAGGGALTPERLARVDAVVVLHAAPLTAAERTLLAGWTGRRGGGVLLAGAHAGAQGFALASTPPGPRAVDGPSLGWDLPPELAPLPGDPVRVAALVSGAPPPGAVRAGWSGSSGVLVLRPLGRGRAAALALTETWRWRMEAGRLAEHREFWRSLVDWLSAPPRDEHVAAVDEALPHPGTRVAVRVYAASAAGGDTPPLLLTRPDGSADTLDLEGAADAVGGARAAFTAADTGVHLVSLGSGTPAAAFRVAESADPPADAWSRLAALAAASGGAMVSTDSLRRLRAGMGGRAGGGSLPLAWLLLAAVLALAGAEWLIRRLRGAP